MHFTFSFYRQNQNLVAKNRCREKYSSFIRGWITVPAKYRGLDCNKIEKAVMKQPQITKGSEKCLTSGKSYAAKKYATQMNKLVDQTLLSASENAEKKETLAEAVDCSLLEALTGKGSVQQSTYSGLQLIVRICEASLYDQSTKIQIKLLKIVAEKSIPNTYEAGLQLLLNIGE